MHVYGQFILIVDKKCFLKLFSINLNDRMDFVEVMKVQLPYFDKEENRLILEEKEEQLYDEIFDNTYFNFKWIEDKLSLYFML